MESSFCGNDTGPNANNHFTREQLEQVGIDLCRTLLIYENLAVPENLTLPQSDKSPDGAFKFPTKKFSEDTQMV